MLSVFESIKWVLCGKARAGKWLMISVGAVALSLPAAAARADDRGRGIRDRWESGWQDRNWRDREWGGRDHHRHDHDDKRIDVDIHIGRRLPRRPEYVTREVRVWVPPVYRTVVDRKWVEPVYRTETERMWVPDRYEEREVVTWHRGHRHVRIERVLVEPGHYKLCERRVLVCEGRWETCERQELVCAGHYETRFERVRVADGHDHRHHISPLAVVNPQLGVAFQIGR